MQTVSLDDIKRHLRVDDDAEDSILAVYKEAAEDYVRTFLDLEGGGLPGEYDSPVTALPGSIKAALLLTIGDLYDNRSGAVVGTTAESKVNENPAVMRLLYPYRRVLGV